MSGQKKSTPPPLPKAPDTSQVLNLVSELELRLGQLKDYQRESDQHTAALHQQAADIAKRQTDLDNLAEAVQQDREQLDARQHQLDASWAEFQQHKKQLDGDHAALAEQREKITAEQAEFDRRSEAWRQQHAAQQSDLDTRRDELEQRQGELETEQARHEQTREQLKADARRLDAQWSELRRAQSDHEAALADASKQLEAIDAQRTELDSVRAGLDEREQSLDAVESALDDDREKLKSDRAALEAQRRKADDLAEQAEQARARVDAARASLEAERESLGTERADLKLREDSLTAQQEHLDRVRRQIAQETAKSGELDKATAAARKEVDELGSRKTELQRQSVELDERRKAFDEQMTALEQLQEELAAQRKELEKRDADFEARQREAEQRRHALEERERTAEEKEKELDLRRAELDERGEELERRASGPASMESTADEPASGNAETGEFPATDDTARHAAMLRRRAEQLEQKQQAYRDALKKSKEQIAQQRDELKTQRDELEAERNKLEARRKELKQAAKLNEQRRGKLRAYLARLREQTESIDQEKVRAKSSSAQFAGLEKERQMLVEVKKFLETSESQMIERWATGKAANTVVAALGVLLALAVISYMVGQKAVQPVWRGSMGLKMTLPAGDSPEDSTETFMEEVEDSLSSDAVLNETLSKLEQRGHRRFTDPASLRASLASGLTTQVSGQELTLTYEHEDKEVALAVAESLGQSLLGYRLALDRQAGRPDSVAISRAGTRSSSEVAQRRLMVSGITFGTTCAIALLAALIMRSWLMKVKRSLDPVDMPLLTVLDKPQTWSPVKRNVDDFDLDDDDEEEDDKLKLTLT